MRHSDGFLIAFVLTFSTSVQCFILVKPNLDSVRVMEVDGSHFLSKISFGIVVLFINHRFGVESSGTQCFTFILEFVTPLPHTCIITLCPLAKLGLHTYRQTITYTHTHRTAKERV